MTIPAIFAFAAVFHWWFFHWGDNKLHRVGAKVHIQLQANQQDGLKCLNKY